MRLNAITQELLDEVTFRAVKGGWDFKVYDKNTGMISFVKPNRDRINIYLTTMSVVTAITHPKMGKNQLYRKNLSFEKAMKCLDNPRLHTGEGYRTKKP